MRIGINENFDTVVLFDMLMTILDDLSIQFFIFDEKFIHLQKLPILRTIVTHILPLLMLSFAWLRF